MAYSLVDRSGKNRLSSGISALITVAAVLFPACQASSALALQSRVQSSLDVRAPDGTRELSNALQRLSNDSRDLNALIDAGNAALTLGDPTAAIGFFARADEIDPNNGRVKAGLASAVLGTENPYEALRLFDTAVALGIKDNKIAADRGLAYDLVGKQQLAQQDYRLALRRDNSDEVTRRYALSLGISGQRDEAETLLTPLLNKQDVDAWRIRAFVLAINNDLDGAIAISDATMQPRGARAIRPFLRYFPKLTASQQAAAAHFGHFPQEANIGRDNPRNAEFASRSARGGSDALPRTSRADAGLIPVGEPLGPDRNGDNTAGKPARVASKAPRRRPGRRALRHIAANTEQPVTAPTDNPPEKVAVYDVVSAPERAAAQPVEVVSDDAIPSAAGPAQNSPGRSDALEAMTDSAETEAASSADQTGVVPGFESLGNSEANSFDLTSTNNSASTNGIAAAESVTVITVNTAELPLATKALDAGTMPEEPQDFASLMADISVPQSELAASSDAVDITAITPAKPKPKAPAKPPEPQHPSRHWVQVAGGANVSGLGREWRRLSKIAPDAFAGKDAWSTPLNRTNRVLAGPFDSKDEAQSFVNLLAKSDISAFTFTSDEGQIISPLK